MPAVAQVPRPRLNLSQSTTRQCRFQSTWHGFNGTLPFTTIISFFALAESSYSVRVLSWRWKPNFGGCWPMKERTRGQRRRTAAPRQTSVSRRKNGRSHVKQCACSLLLWQGRIKVIGRDCAACWRNWWRLTLRSPLFSRLFVLPFRTTPGISL